MVRCANVCVKRIIRPPYSGTPQNSNNKLETSPTNTVTDFWLNCGLQNVVWRLRFALRNVWCLDIALAATVHLCHAES